MQSGNLLSQMASWLFHNLISKSLGFISCLVIDSITINDHFNKDV
jgi:hypothetical protein